MISLGSLIDKKLLAYLCAGDTNLGPGIDVDATMWLPADATPDRIRDADD